MEMLQEITEAVDVDKTIKELNDQIDKMIKDKNKKGLDILSKELDKILKGMK
jgi:predicted transcriptional regulator